MFKPVTLIVWLVSIVALNFANVAVSQPPSTDPGDPFGAPAAGEVPDPFQAPGGSTQAKQPGSGKEFTLDGVLLTASRVRSYMVDVSSLQIVEGVIGGLGGMEGGMGEGMPPGMGGGGMGEGGYAGMGGMGAGGMGGMGMGGMGGMGMGGGMGGMGGYGMGGMQDMRMVVALIMDDEKVAGRTRIEVLAPQGSQDYVRLESLTGARPSKAKADKKVPPLWSPAAAKLIKDTISLKIWKEDAIKSLKNEEGKGELAAASEKLLKEVLSEEYDTQLGRQHFELVRLEERLKRIQEEFIRRKQAKDRVIDVQLGKIILEAQGILGNN